MVFPFCFSFHLKQDQWVLLATDALLAGWIQESFPQFSYFAYVAIQQEVKNECDFGEMWNSRVSEGFNSLKIILEVISERYQVDCNK